VQLSSRREWKENTPEQPITHFLHAYGEKKTGFWRFFTFFLYKKRLFKIFLCNKYKIFDIERFEILMIKIKFESQPHQVWLAFYYIIIKLMWVFDRTLLIFV